MPKHLSMKDARLIKKHFYIIKTLGSVGRKQRLKILKNAPNSLFKVFNVIFNHCITRVIPVNARNRNTCKTLLKTKQIQKTKGLKKKLYVPQNTYSLLDPPKKRDKKRPVTSYTKMLVVNMMSCGYL